MVQLLILRLGLTDNISMNLPESFYKAVGISQANWQKLLNEVPKGQDPVYWALKNRRIMSTGYFSWAKEAFGVPVLGAEVIESTEWPEIKSQFKPSNEGGFIKFYSWDNIDYYLGVVPPENHRTKGVCFLLTSPDVLDDLMQPKQNHQEEVHETDIPEITATAPQVDAQAQTDTNEASAGSFDNFDSFDTPPLPEDSTDEVSNELPDVPEGLEGLVSEDELSATPATNTEEPMEMPDGLGGLEGLDDFSTPPVPDAESESNEAPADILSFDQATTESPTEEPVTNTSQTEIRFSSEFSNLQGQLTNAFKQSAIFQYINGEFVPVSWSDEFNSANITALPTDSPSAFRIVGQSHHVYLGHIANTEANDQFVKNWFKGQAPEKIIIQPVMMNKNLIGAFMGVCDTNAANHMLLRKGEEFAKDMMMAWPQSSSKAA